MKKLLLPSLVSISIGMNAQQVFPTMPNSQKGTDYHVELNERLLWINEFLVLTQPGIITIK